MTINGGGRGGPQRDSGRHGEVDGATAALPADPATSGLALDPSPRGKAPPPPPKTASLEKRARTVQDSRFPSITIKHHREKKKDLNENRFPIFLNGRTQ